MQRRSFIKLTLTTTLAVAYQACNHEKLKGSKPFYYPQVLMACTDERSMNDIGKAYLQRTSGEQTEKSLLAALYKDDTTGNLATNTDESVIQQHLSSRIKADFNNKRTIVLEGWVLSITEARQCGLFYLRS
jgi:hypothetical protein